MGFGFSWSDSMNNEAILKALQPHPTLKYLAITEYSGNTVFPDWMVSLINLRMIQFNECINCENFPPLGKLSSLESIVFPRMLKVKRMGIVGFVIGREGDDHVTIMPSLHLLEINSCPKLKVLPKQLLQRAALTYLVIEGCPILSERYRKRTGENWTDISHIPVIKIDGEMGFEEFCATAYELFEQDGKTVIVIEELASVSSKSFAVAQQLQKKRMQKSF
ncbi:hypothetical protein JRO89_XS02G0161600 [Xanthoceras sorbifolium]|uniref:R13L1/DRL21-like LRR repeat region domain-containing protein n=1 Tax=Xanthoceras sorbifolium TaxID=99658 RepID=A0ABQ8IGE8_9ROSI|nr:hypothetical protein JRO89_XS02G0161600 [Xanthoceras sorbifolium]